jgi:hypothetical protein
MTTWVSRNCKFAQPVPPELTTEEDWAYGKNMEYYLNEGYSDEEADEAAWQDLLEEFPRLKTIGQG